MKTMKKVSILMLFVAIFAYITVVNISGVNAGGRCEVKFTFDGLQAIAFGDPTRVSDGILDAHHHNPKIEIKQISNGKEKLIQTIEGKELYKKVLNVLVPNKQLHPQRYYSPDMTKDTTDFRWCLDIENDLFQRELYLKEEKFYTKIHFQVGEFVTDHITDDKYQFVTNTKIHSFKREVGFPAGHLQLQEKDSLVISGLEKDITLYYLNGVSYQVNITNLPPKDMMNMDHFVFYYDVLKTDVPRFMPIVAQKAAYFPRPYLCAATVLGRSSIE